SGLAGGAVQGARLRSLGVPAERRAPGRQRASGRGEERRRGEACRAEEAGCRAPRRGEEARGKESQGACLPGHRRQEGQRPSRRGLAGVLIFLNNQPKQTGAAAPVFFSTPAETSLRPENVC